MTIAFNQHSENTVSKPSIDEYQQLIYAISHNLGAPLRGIVNFSQLLQDSYASQLDDKAKRWLAFLNDEGLQAQAMIAGLLTHSRLSSEVLDKETINLSSLAEKIISLTLVPKVNTAECVELMPLPTIDGYYEHWFLLFEALITNALLYQKNAHKPLLKISYWSSDQEFVLRFEDNGIGVTEKNYAQIPLVFKRLHSAKEYPGIGMGLSYVKRILERQQGKLVMNRSALGGLQVDCYLPLNIRQITAL